jgi:hypothetical protein
MTNGVQPKIRSTLDGPFFGTEGDVNKKTHLLKWMFQSKVNL